MRTLICLLLLLSSDSYGQLDSFLGRWTNGFEYYESGKVDDRRVLFSGGNLHEGGSAFTIKIDSDNSISISGRFPDDDFPPSFGAINDRLHFEIMNELRVIILKSKSGAIKGILREMRYAESLEELVILNKINCELSGKYEDLKNGREIIFHPNKPIAQGLAHSQSYEFEYEYDFPLDLIKFKSGESFFYELNDDGLDLFETRIDEYGDKKKGTKVFSLAKREWFNPFEGKNLPGNYAFASLIPLIDGILSSFSSKKLRIMRNEIFARHGQIFKTKEIREYFERQDWYSPEYTDVSHSLSPLEKLNVHLITRFERLKMAVK